MELNPFSLLVFDFFRGLSKKEQNLHEKNSEFAEIFHLFPETQRYPIFQRK